MIRQFRAGLVMRRALSIAMSVLAVLAHISAAQASPVASTGYSISLFAAAPVGATNPDSIAVVGGNVFVGYGNSAATDGSSGSSTIAEFDSQGHLIGTTSVAGHNDGLRYNAATGQLWSLQNEDANPTLILINPNTLAQSPAMGFSATPHGGGYDDAAFSGTQAFISASNPANNPNSQPAIVSATVGGSTVSVAGILNGNASATSINSGSTVTLNLQDPDSLIFAPDGRLVLDSQADDELVFLTNPGTGGQSVQVLALSNSVDDTVFVGSGPECVLVSDRNANNVDEVCGAFTTGQALSAAADDNFLGALDLATGLLTPIVTGLDSPHGLALIAAPAAPEPASIVMLWVGLAGIGFARRRKA